MDSSADVESYIIELNPTKGYMFELDKDFNIVGIRIGEDIISISDWSNSIDVEEKHTHKFTEEEILPEFECSPTKKMHTCTCGYNFTEITDKGKDHQWGDIENTKEATCVDNGINTMICQFCEMRKEEEIEALGHKEASRYSYSTEGHYRCCERCGERTMEIEQHNSNPCTVCGYTGRFTITYDLSKMTSNNNSIEVLDGYSYTAIITPENTLAYQRPETITIRMGGNVLTSGYTYNNVSGEIKINSVKGNIVISAYAERYYGQNTSFTNAKESTVGDQNFSANIDQSYRVRVFKFVPTETATYRFYSADSTATARTTDPYVYIYDDSTDLDELDNKALQYSKTGETSYLANGCVTSNDDGGDGYNFSVTYNCIAGRTYYMVVRTYTPSKKQNFVNINIKKQ